MVHATGLGIVSSAGVGPEAFWSGLMSGRSFVRRITRFDASRARVQVASEIADRAFGADLVASHQHERPLLYAEAAARQALLDAGIDGQIAPDRAGIIVSTSVGPTITAATAFLQGAEETSRGLPSVTWPHPFPAQIARRLSLRHALRGYAAVISTGCASGADALGVAMDAIEWGYADAILVVGVEAPIEPATMNSFDVIGALSRRNAEPERASRPFDRDRDGFVLGEGAAAIVLERADHAVARRAKPRGSMRGYATTTDACHLTAPREDLQAATAAVRTALTRADATVADVDYISAHATSTPVGDVVETRLIREVFQRRADGVPASSLKSIIGHQSGGAGVFQGVANLLSLQRQRLVPTVNLDAPGPGCDLDYVPNTPRSARVDCILQHTFGFCGKNSAIVWGRAEEAR